MSTAGEAADLVQPGIRGWCRVLTEIPVGVRWWAHSTLVFSRWPGIGGSHAVRVSTSIPTLAVAVLCLAASADAQTEITAAGLGREFDANPIAAERKYEDKALIVSGVVDRISKGVFGSGYVNLKGANQFQDIAAFFSDEDFLASLTKGQWISLKCEGATAGTFMGVSLDKCRKHLVVRTKPKQVSRNRPVVKRPTAPPAMKGGWACSGTDKSGQARKASNASEGLTLTRTRERTVLGFTGLPSAYVTMREVDLMIDQGKMHTRNSIGQNRPEIELDAELADELNRGSTVALSFWAGGDDLHDSRSSLTGFAAAHYCVSQPF